MRKHTNIGRTLLGTFAALALAGGANAVHAKKGDTRKGDTYTLQGTCAFLPADRATEFHGNPDRSKLNLGMAGNQWAPYTEGGSESDAFSRNGNSPKWGSKSYPGIGGCEKEGG